MFSLASRPLSHHFTHRSWMEPCSARSPSGSAYKIPATEQALHSECMQWTGASPDPTWESMWLTGVPSRHQFNSPRHLHIYTIQAMLTKNCSTTIVKAGPIEQGILEDQQVLLSKLWTTRGSKPECRDTRGNTKQLSQGRPSDQLPHNYPSACWPQVLAHWWKIVKATIIMNRKAVVLLTKELKN